MALTQIPEIEEFPMDGKYWRVDWRGAIVQNPSNSNEPMFQIVISPFTTEPYLLDQKTRIGINSTDANQQRTIQIGVGQFPLVETGSIWKNGICQAFSAGELVTLEDVDISPNSCQSICATEKIQGQNIIPWSQYRFGSAGAASKLVAISYQGDLYGLLIPALELVRFYYAMSTNLAHIFFSGIWQIEPNSFMNLKHNGYCSKEDRVYIGLRQGIYDEEGWILARLLRSKLAEDACTKIYDDILQDRLRGQLYTNPTCNFPFHGLTKLTARVKYIKTSPESPWRRLVLGIEECTAPFPYTNLTVARDNDANPANKETDKPDNQKQPYVRNDTKSNEQKDTTPLQSQRDTNKKLSPVQLSLPSERFSHLHNRKPDKPTKKENKYISSGTLVEQLDLEAFGTGQGSYAEDNKRIQAVKVTPEHTRRKAAPPSFDLFNRAITKLNKYTDITAVLRNPMSAMATIPLLKPAGKRQWSYLDSKSEEKRQVIIADITYKHSHFCLIEFETRPRQPATVALIHSRSGRPNDLLLLTLMTRCAQESGVWKNIHSSDLSLEIICMKHSWHDDSSFAVAVSKKLKAS